MTLRSDMYQKFCVPLMMINNNVYTFISGIFVSLSINIFTSMCVERFSITSKWFMYLASLIFLIASAFCMYLSAKLSRFQGYIHDKRIETYDEKVKIILEATQEKKRNWIAVYICFISLTITGCVLLSLNFKL